jgi:hypothetical protein
MKRADGEPNGICLICAKQPGTLWGCRFAAVAARLRRTSWSSRGRRAACLLALGERSGTPLYIGWCVGDQQFRISAEGTPGDLAAGG